MSHRASYRCLLDKFPVELLHLIFSYLSGHDILRAFLPITPYLDSVLVAYNRYQLNFQSILKTHFDLVCRHIHPNCIISLTLSDGVDTPGQSALFLSLFRIERFCSNLRSMTLCNLDDNSMRSIDGRWNMFIRLSSLSIVECVLPIPSNMPSLLPQLSRLTIHHGGELFETNTALPRLRHLAVVNSCTSNQLQNIFSCASRLISLNVRLGPENQINFDPMSSYLTRLVLNMSLCEVPMSQLERFLSFLPCLGHLEIEARGDMDLCNGHRWEVFIINHLPSLITFNFKFQLKLTVMFNAGGGPQVLLPSFSTPFWLEEKRWFVAIEWQLRLLYSVPRFALESADSNFRPPVHSTVPDDSFFYDHISALAVWGELSHRFRYVDELWIVSNPTCSTLKTAVDLSRVRRVIFSSSDTEFSFDTFIDLIRQAPRLDQIRFLNIPLLFDQHRSVTFEQIRKLELSRGIHNIEQLSRLFPRVERLDMRIESLQTIARALNMFSMHLSCVTFDWGPRGVQRREELVTREWLQKTIGHRNFTFAIDNTSIRLWIGAEEALDTAHTGCLPWRSLRKFLCHR